MALYIFYLSGGNSYVRYLYRSGGRWYSNYNWLGNDWNDNSPAARFAILFISLPVFSRKSFVFEAVRSSHLTFFQFHQSFLIKQYIFYYQLTWSPKVSLRIF